jgi:hypothetical protein
MASLLPVPRGTFGVILASSVSMMLPCGDGIWKRYPRPRSGRNGAIFGFYARAVIRHGTGWGALPHPTNFLGLLNPGLRASFGRRRSWARSSRRLPGSDRSSVFSSWLDGGTRSIPRCHRAGLGPVHVVRRIFSSRPVINSNSGRTFEAGSDRSGHCRDEPLVHLHELGS